MIEDYRALQKKIAATRASGLDLSTEEDLAIAVMNLISLEEHFFFTGSKTDKPEYFDMLQEAREMRKKLLARMIDKTEGEVWCASKHLLATSMRLMEVGTKLDATGDREKAKETFEMSYKAFNMFFALRLKITALPKVAGPETPPMSYDDIMKGLLDCCKE